MTDRALPRCRRTDRIVGAVLDGTETAADRLHAATCAMCSFAVERARAFERSLALAAVDVSDSIPDPASLPTARRWFGAGRFAARVVTVGAAVAAGLLLATLIGQRIPAPGTPGAFATATDAHAALAGLGMPCRGARELVVICQVSVNGHTHRVEMAERDGVVVSATATIANTDDKRLDRSGSDVLFGRIAGAILGGEARSDAQAWLDERYSACRDTCSVELETVSLSIESSPTSVTLTLRER